jgi:thiol-disulfide isomerase/thioredoxin
MGAKLVVVPLIVALLALAGCAGEGPGGATGGASASQESQATADLAFVGETADGTRFSGEQLVGKPAVLWFWAPWCPTCRAQSAGVTRLAQQYAGQVNVVGVGGLGDVRDIRDYAGQVDALTHLIDPEGALWRHFGVTAQSTYVVLDANGIVVAEGYLDDRALAEMVAELAA